MAKSQPEGDRIRVLFLVDEVSDDVGGAERFAVGLATSLPSDAFAVSLCATRGIGGRLAGDLDRAGVRYFALERRSSLDLTAFRTLVAHLRSESIQVLHAHKIGSNLWGTFFGRLARVPVIVAHEHTWSYEGQPLRRIADGWFIGRLVSAFVAVSDADRQRMIELEGVPAHRAVTIPTAFVPREPQPRFELRKRLEIPSDAPVIGTVAQLRPQKNIEVLIDAFQMLLRRVPNAHLVIVGDGPQRGALEGAAQSAGVAQQTHFAGLQTDLSSVLGAFDVAAMSSDFEGLPLFIFECMQHRTPLVATAVGGIPDVVEDGRTGLLVPPRDPRRLSESLARVVESPGFGAQLAEEASKRLGEYTMERAAERFAELYRRLLAERSG